jgi:APA family basic amino acid/polyamine antiporter
MLSSLLASLLIFTNYSRSLTGLFTFMGLISAMTTLVLYIVCAAAALKLRPGPRSSAIPIVALVSIGYCLWAFWGAGVETALWGLALLATGLPVFWLMRRPRLVQSTA